MLAYTFWHWPREDASEYERHLAEFFQVMEEDKPLGYLGGLTLRHGAAPWLPGPAFLDWYRLGSFADLGTLNEGAVSGSRRAAHDDVAHMAKGGAGGVYELQQGPADFHDARVAHWFGKPEGMRYAELFGELAGVAGSLWMRQMVLGPSPEFVLFAPRDVALSVTARRVDVSCLWPR
ncbi:MAG TPA: hypothetical protein VFL36_00110 [Myxococcales bacterium]|nr:hypothetical protein [Myxococcales bacterium]